MMVAGLLLIWGHSAVTSQVRNELTAQKINFPAKNSRQVTTLPEADVAAVSKYSGQLITTGAQAEAYADHFMPAQLKAIDHGLTYDQVNGKLATAGRDRNLFIQAADLFRQQTIQAGLLNAYGYSKIGQILLIGAVLAFAGLAVLLFLAAFGMARRVVLEAQALLSPAVEAA
jgi:hypothetical protein